MSFHAPLEESSIALERRVGSVCSIVRVVRAEGARRPEATIVVVGARGAPSDELTAVLVNKRVQVLQVESTESVPQLLHGFDVDVVIFSADVSRLGIAAVIQGLTDDPGCPDLFALFANALDGAWLSRMGVLPIPNWSAKHSIRSLVLRRLDRA
jgi:hypothetical protein